MEKRLKTDNRMVTGYFDFYHGIPGNATGIQLLLSFCFAIFSLSYA